jgi:hypothetical protein
LRLLELNRLLKTILPRNLTQASTTMEKMQLSHFWVMTLTRRYVCQSVCRRRLKVPKVLKND